MTKGITTAEGKSKKANLLVCAIVLIGAVVRFYGINFGLPHTESRPDESTIVTVAFGLGSGDLNPHFFHYPTLYIYMVFICYVLYFCCGLLSGKYTGTFDLASEFFTDPTNFFLIDRCLAALLGTVTIVVVYKIAQKLCGRKTGLIAALFLCFAYLHARDSHFGVTDVPLVFFTMCSVLYMVCAYQHRTARYYILAGLCAGLATSTKYSGIFLTGPMVLVHLCNVIDEKQVQWKHIPDKRIVLFFVCLIVFFLVGTPFALLDFATFREHFLKEAAHVREGHWTIVLGRGFWYHIRYTLYYGLGASLFIASLAGIVVLTKRDWRKALLLCSYPLLYYIVIGMSPTVFVRYAIPLIPFLCITAAVGSVRLCETFLHNRKPLLVNTFIASLSALIIAPSAYNAWRFNRVLVHEDNRVIAADWVERNINESVSIYQSFWPGLQLLPPQEELIQEYQDKIAQGGKPDEILKKQIQNMQVNNRPGYLVVKYDERKQTFIYNDMAIDTVPDYIIIGEYPLHWHSPKPSKELATLLTDSYRLVKSFIALDGQNSEQWFDQLDAFYVPFVGFNNIQRPGPNIYIYQKTDT